MGSPENGCERERNRNLVNRDPYEGSISDRFGNPESRSYSKAIEECMDTDRDEWYDGDMIQVFMWVFMRMVFVRVVMMVWSEEFLYEVDEEKPSYECVDCILALLEWFSEDMDEWNREHRSRSKGDEEVDKCLIDLSQSDEEYTDTRYQEEDEEGEEHGGSWLASIQGRWEGWDGRSDGTVETIERRWADKVGTVEVMER